MVNSTITDMGKVLRRSIETHQNIEQLVYEDSAISNRRRVVIDNIMNLRIALSCIKRIIRENIE